MERDQTKETCHIYVIYSCSYFLFIFSNSVFILVYPLGATLLGYYAEDQKGCEFDDDSGIRFLFSTLKLHFGSPL